MTLLEQLSNLHQLRQKSVLLKQEKALAYEEWQARNAELLSNVLLTESQLQEAEKRLKDDAVVKYAIEGIRNPLPGLEIRIFQEMRYDPKEALLWAKTHDMALALDTKAFDKIANLLTFVEVAQVPKCLIASDLSKFVEVK